jgi:hypothetical protein
MPNGLYAIDKEFFIEIPGTQEPVIRRSAANTTELLLPVDVKQYPVSVSYSFIW